MLVSTKAIVLSKFKYRENDLIVKCYTQNDGVVSYLLRGVLKNRKGHVKAAYFQPLSQLHLETDVKNNRSLQFIKEVRVAYVYSSLHTQVQKGAVAMFLSEVLTESLKEEEPNDTVFQFLQASLQWLDAHEYFSNFHLLFLLKLTKHLGFYPDIEGMECGAFNLVSGRFEMESNELHIISGESLAILKRLLLVKFDDLPNIKLNSEQRKGFLEMMLQYYQLQLGHFKRPKSLDVFIQVFH